MRIIWVIYDNGLKRYVFEEWVQLFQELHFQLQK